MLESLITLSTTTALLLGSPGPAPIALAATSATFGIKKSLPFLLGILAGLLVVIVCAATGLAALFSAFPNFRIGVQIIGLVYILYVALKIATAPVQPNNSEKSAAPTFADGFILNLLNPKAYAALFAIFSRFLLPFTDASTRFLVTGLVCFAIAVLVDGVWVMFGGLIRPLFNHPVRARLLRKAFALSMVIVVSLTF